MDNLYAFPVPPAAPDKPYTVNRKMFVLALGVELVVIGFILVTGWQFANAFAGKLTPENVGVALPLIGERTQAWIFAMAATVVAAAIELCRVPLATAAAANPSAVKRVILWLAVFGAVFISAKSLSQIIEMQFHTRLVEVTRAKNVVKEEHANLARLETRSENPDGEVERLDQQIAQTMTEIGGYQKNIDTIGKRPPAVTTYVTTGTGKTRRRVPVTRRQAWDGEGVMQDRDEAESRLRDLRAKRNEAQAASTTAADEVATQKVRLTQAEAHHSDAVLHSQLHSFTGMWVSKAPNDVTDGEVFAFMKVFVLVFAIAGALVPTVLAWGSIDRKPRPKLNPAHGRSGKLEVIPSFRDAVRDIGIKLEKAA